MPSERTMSAFVGSLKKVAAILRDEGIPFALGGGLAAWARGGPETDHDVDFFLKPEDAERAQAALAGAGLRADRPPEDWLHKVWDGDVLIDLIFRPSGGPVSDEWLRRAEEREVMAMRLPVIALEDLMVTKLLALKEQEPDYAQVLKVARALREQIAWDEVRERTAESPFARAFFTIVEGLDIVRPRAGEAAAAAQRSRPAFVRGSHLRRGRQFLPANRGNIRFRPENRGQTPVFGATFEYRSRPPEALVASGDLARRQKKNWRHAVHQSSARETTVRESSSSIPGRPSSRFGSRVFLNSTLISAGRPGSYGRTAPRSASAVRAPFSTSSRARAGGIRRALLEPRPFLTATVVSPAPSSSVPSRHAASSPVTSTTGVPNAPHMAALIAVSPTSVPLNQRFW